jgi:hypothetical protein
MNKVPKEKEGGAPVIDSLRALARLLARLAARKMRTPNHPEGEPDGHPEQRKSRAHEV